MRGILGVWRLLGDRRSRENCDATAVRKRGEILGLRANKPLLLAREFAKKDKFNERGRQSVSEESALA